MKRIEQLHKLSHEHHTSLVTAKRIATAAEKESDQELLDTLELVKHYYDSELEEHFQHEERTIFTPIFNNYKELVPIATTLLKEHGYIRMLIPKMTPESARKDLADFALMLKNHTRMEERELFPAVETLFTEDEMAAILNFKPLD